MPTDDESASALISHVQLIQTQLTLQQEHVKLIRELAVRCRDNFEIVTVLQRSLLCVQSSQLLNQQAFEVGQEYVYVLELESDKYYVGTSASLSNRLHQHFVGEGAIWTRKYRPIKIVQIQLGGKEVEKAVTLAFMKDKSYENVRGSHWCHLRMDNPPKEVIQLLNTQ